MFVKGYAQFDTSEQHGQADDGLRSGSGTLAKVCERTLVAAARENHAATRQQARAAARRFVRRHRNDAGYLSWVLRSVGACSALAVALLGLSAAPASADLAPFNFFPVNPLNGQDVGSYSTPSLGDLDGDGDLDVVSGGQYGGVYLYFENTGGSASPAFIPQTGAENPLASQGAGALSAPTLVDLDGDGDLDVVGGTGGVGYLYFENTGSATNPTFIARTGAANPLPLAQGTGYALASSLGDLDDDGDLDLFGGDLDGNFHFYENTGSATNPLFIARTGAANPLNGQDVGVSSKPSLGDLDDDGDLDLVGGESDGIFNYFENTGSATSPVFTPRTGAANPLSGWDVGSSSSPSLGDLDGDGDLELVAGDVAGIFLTLKNLGGLLVPRAGAANPLNGQDVGFNATSSLGDLDGDGDPDLVVGSAFGGTFLYYRNTGSALSPVFVQQTGAANPLNGQNVGIVATPALGDLDGDGDLDLLAGANDGVFTYFKNTGTVTTPAFEAQTGALNPMNLNDIGSASAPSLGDLDGDGDLDLVSGAYDGTFFYYKNTGSAASPAFVAQPGPANPLNFQDLGYRSTPSLGDVDGDGDLDLVAGETFGSFFYFENTGSAASAAFLVRTGAASPLNGQDVGLSSAPALGDLDGDGDLDLLVGENYGTFAYYQSFIPQLLSAFELTGLANPLAGQDVGSESTTALGDVDGDGDLDLVAGELYGEFLYYENTGTAVAPAFVPRTGAANPLDGHDVGFDSAPSLGDLDGDGDLDLLAGEDSGTFRYFENTGDAVVPAFLERTGAAHPLDGNDVGLDSAPALGDLDGDGDLDLVAGETYGTFLYYENVGIETNPDFVERTGAANPLAGRDVDNLSNPSLGDLDGDGDLDLVAGNIYGAFKYFKNHGSMKSPAFGPLTGAANPLDGEFVLGTSAPAAGDLDGDGDLDLATGSSDGTFAVHYFPEPARGLLLSAGVALLGWLARSRKRRLAPDPQSFGRADRITSL